MLNIPVKLSTMERNSHQFYEMYIFKTYILYHIILKDDNK